MFSSSILYSKINVLINSSNLFTKTFFLILNSRFLKKKKKEKFFIFALIQDKNMKGASLLLVKGNITEDFEIFQREQFWKVHFFQFLHEVLFPFVEGNIIDFSIFLKKILITIIGFQIFFGFDNINDMNFFSFCRREYYKNKKNPKKYLDSFRVVFFYFNFFLILIFFFVFLLFWKFFVTSSKRENYIRSLEFFWPYIYF